MDSNDTERTAPDDAGEITPDATGYPREQDYDTLAEWWAACEAWEIGGSK